MFEQQVQDIVAGVVTAVCVTIPALAVTVGAAAVLMVV